MADPAYGWLARWSKACSFLKLFEDSSTNSRSRLSHCKLDSRRERPICRRRVQRHVVFRSDGSYVAAIVAALAPEGANGTNQIAMRILASADLLPELVGIEDGRALNPIKAVS